MSQNLQVIQSSKPVPMAAEPRRQLDAMWSALDRTSWREFSFPSPDMAPSDAERMALTIRLDQLDAWLAPASQAAIDTEIAGMFAVMASPVADEAEKVAIMRLYRNDLQGIPAFALIQACGEFRRGLRGDGVFVPRPGEICKAAREIAQDYRSEQTIIGRVLNAKVLALPSPESRARAVEAARLTADAVRKIANDGAAFHAPKRRMNDARDERPKVSEPTPIPVGPVPDYLVAALERRGRP